MGVLNFSHVSIGTAHLHYYVWDITVACSPLAQHGTELEQGLGSHDDMKLGLEEFECLL